MIDVTTLFIICIGVFSVSLVLFDYALFTKNRSKKEIKGRDVSVKTTDLE